jgi:hypothetical protein
LCDNFLYFIYKASEHNWFESWHRHRQRHANTGVPGCCFPLVGLERTPRLEMARLLLAGTGAIPAGDPVS